MIEIMISEEIHPNLGMTSSASKLWEEINKQNIKKIIIDFSNVIMMSFTFAREYLFQKSLSDKIVIEKNMPKIVQETFDYIQKN